MEMTIHNHSSHAQNISMPIQIDIFQKLSGVRTLVGSQNPFLFFWSGRGVTLRGTWLLAAERMTLRVTWPRAQPDASPSVGICSGPSFWVNGHRRGYSVSRGVAVVTTCGGGCESSDCGGRSRLGRERRSPQRGRTLWTIRPSVVGAA